MYLDTGLYMKFVINGVVKYNSADGTLLLPDHSEDMLTLTRITNELLLLFINNNNISLSRDEILNQLWESKGLSSSSNNLNNYISMLRKALEQCGCVGVITTIPKFGFIFEADIVLVVEQENDDFHAINKIAGNVSPPPPHIIEESEVRSDRSTIFFSKKALGMVLIILVMVVFFSPEIYNFFILNSNKNLVFSVKNCRIYMGDNRIIENESKESLEVIKSNVINLDLNCERKANVYYFSGKKTNALGEDIFLRKVFYCPYDSKDACENYYF